MTFHTKNKEQRAARASTLQLFDEESKVINRNVASTTVQQGLDLDMFVKTAKTRADIQEKKLQSSVSYSQQSSKVVAQSDELQTEINASFENPFHDLLAFFNGDESRTDLMNQQRALTGKLNRINQDNVNTAKAFDEQTALVEQGLKDQLGFASLKFKQTERLDELVQIQSNKQVKRNEFEIGALRTMDRKTLVANLEDPNGIFSKGLIEAQIREIDAEELDLRAKKRASLKDKQLDAQAVIGFTGLIELTQRLNVMKASGVDIGTIDGIRITRADVEKGIGERVKSRADNSEAINSINQTALLQDTMANDLLRIAKKQDLEQMSPKTAAQFKFADTMNQKAKELTAFIADNAKNGIPPTQQQFNVLQTVKQNALFLSDKAVKDGATEAAQRFSGDEVAHASALKYYTEGRFDDAKDARNVFINLTQNETPSAIANESVVFGKTLEGFAKTLTDNLFEEFPDAVDKELQEIDRKTGKSSLNINSLLAGNKTRKINFANAWSKAVNKSASQEQIDNGGESNFWVSEISNSMNTVQSEVATTEFVNSEVVKLYPEFEQLLTNVGGGLKLDFLNAPAGTMSKMASEVALLEARLIEKGALTKDTNISEILMQSFTSEGTVSVVSREFNRSSIALAALLRPLYGRKGNFVESYMETFRADIKNIGAQNFKQQAAEIAAKEEQRRNEIVDEELQRGQSGLLGE